jgi:hypothetical protein
VHARRLDLNAAFEMVKYHQTLVRWRFIAVKVAKPVAWIKEATI